MPEYVHFLWISASVLLLIAIAEWMYRTLKIDAEITRKMVHLGSGLLSLTMPTLFHTQWPVLLMCGLFQLLLVISYQNGQLKSIHAVERKTYGSLIYPMAIFVIYLIWYYSGGREDQRIQSYSYFYLPILILAICDPVSRIFGIKYPMILFRKANGNLGMVIMYWTLAFLMSYLLLLSSHHFQYKYTLPASAFIAAGATITNIYSKKGLGKLFVPIVVMVAMYLAEYFF